MPVKYLPNKWTSDGFFNWDSVHIPYMFVMLFLDTPECFRKSVRLCMSLSLILVNNNGIIEYRVFSFFVILVNKNGQNQVRFHCQKNVRLWFFFRMCAYRSMCGKWVEYCNFKLYELLKSTSSLKCVCPMYFIFPNWQIFHFMHSISR